MLSEFPFANLILSPQFILYIFLLLLFQSKFFNIPVHKKIIYMHMHIEIPSLLLYIFFFHIFSLISSSFFSRAVVVFSFLAQIDIALIFIYSTTQAHIHTRFSLSLSFVCEIFPHPNGQYTHTAPTNTNTLGPRTIENFHDL